MKRRAGFFIRSTSTTHAKISRLTRESEVSIYIDINKRGAFKINTPIYFLNHLIESIAWRACSNVKLEFRTKLLKLTHMIAEDTGNALGRAYRVLLEKRQSSLGINGFGFSFVALDEALALVSLSVEGRANTFIDIQCQAGKTHKVEDMISSDIIAFLEGFSQGLGCTLHVVALKGKDPHHVWESVFRGLGEALKQSIRENKWRKGLSVGVKGTLD